ncbi:HD domain-containing protein [Pseudomonas fluorescens]|nr:HD domain-containing protein [Pseudomonas fluorescens]
MSNPSQYIVKPLQQAYHGIMNREHDFYPQALAYAHEMYAHKVRSGGVRPYISHPLKLVEILVSYGYKDDTLLCGAILHDAIEENDHSADVIRKLSENCPAVVFSLIQEVTDKQGLEREARRQDQIDRAKNYSSLAALVRLSDKLANMHDILEYPPRWAPKHIVSYCEFAMAVVDICRPHGPAIAAQCDLSFEQVKLRYVRIKHPESPNHNPN